MDERTIKDGAGRDHKVIMQKDIENLPISAASYLGISSPGFPNAGLAVAYVKRILKNNPDQNSEWHIVPECGRYFIFIR
jgi:hypothetical protein